MRGKIAIILLGVGGLFASSPALAEHETADSAPRGQTESFRGPKARQTEEHWGKHHHHGIYLEGSDYERAPQHSYD